MHPYYCTHLVFHISLCIKWCGERTLRNGECTSHKAPEKALEDPNADARALVQMALACSAALLHGPTDLAPPVTPVFALTHWDFNWSYSEHPSTRAATTATTSTSSLGRSILVVPPSAVVTEPLLHSSHLRHGHNHNHSFLQLLSWHPPLCHRSCLSNSYFQYNRAPMFRIHHKKNCFLLYHNRNHSPPANSPGPLLFGSSYIFGNMGFLFRVICPSLCSLHFWLFNGSTNFLLVTSFEFDPHPIFNARIRLQPWGQVCFDSGAIDTSRYRNSHHISERYLC